jgi:hypothetical protein
MKSLIENFINGNITDARRSSKRFSCEAIASALVDFCGYSIKKATLSARYLKTGDGFQAACDAI